MLPLLYRGVARLSTPLAIAYLAQRRKHGKEDPLRFRERRGLASRSRPLGPLVWIHAASVGEATAILGLVERLLELRPGIEVLVTTGTLTSARLLEKRYRRSLLHSAAELNRGVVALVRLERLRDCLGMAA